MDNFQILQCVSFVVNEDVDMFENDTKKNIGIRNQQCLYLPNYPMKLKEPIWALLMNVELMKDLMAPRTLKTNEL